MVINHHHIARCQRHFVIWYSLCLHYVHNTFYIHHDWSQQARQYFRNDLFCFALFVVSITLACFAKLDSGGNDWAAACDTTTTAKLTMVDVCNSVQVLWNVNCLRGNTAWCAADEYRTATANLQHANAEYGEYNEANKSRYCSQHIFTYMANNGTIVICNWIWVGVHLISTYVISLSIL